MAETGDFLKMKVPELKKKLKELNLPVSGNKSELIARLQEAMGAEPLGVSGEEDEFDENVLNESEDILNDSSIVDEDKENGDKEEVKLEDDIPSEKEPNAVEVTKTKPALLNMTDDERKAERAKKFGIDSKKLARAQRFNLGAEDDKKKARAERFGISAAETKVAATGGNLDKLKQRAERFGSVTAKSLTKVEESEKLKKRAERFGTSTLTEVKPKPNEKLLTDEKLLKRKERFGNMTVADTPAAVVETQTTEVPIKKKKFTPITAP